MNGKSVRIACEGAATVVLDKLEDFQGDLKSLNKTQFEMLKKELLETGFAFPFNVWKDPEGKLNIIGGHQRRRVLMELEKDGYQIPPLPVVWIKAKNLKEAKRRVLQDVAQYGKVSDQGLYQFLIESKLDPIEFGASFKLPEIDSAKFLEEYFTEPVDPLDIGATPPDQLATGQDKVASAGVKMVHLYYGLKDHTEFEQICARLGEAFASDNMSDTILLALRAANENHKTR